MLLPCDCSWGLDRPAGATGCGVGEWGVRVPVPIQRLERSGSEGTAPGVARWGGAAGCRGEDSGKSTKKPKQPPGVGEEQSRHTGVKGAGAGRGQSAASPAVLALSPSHFGPPHILALCYTGSWEFRPVSVLTRLCPLLYPPGSGVFFTWLFTPSLLPGTGLSPPEILLLLGSPFPGAEIPGTPGFPSPLLQSLSPLLLE